MLVSLFGLPTPLYAWTVEAAKQLIASRYGGCRDVQASSLADVMAAIDDTASASQPILLIGHAPEPELIGVLVSNSVRIGVAMELPSAHGLDLVRTGAADARTAAQRISLTCSALHDVIVGGTAVQIVSEAGANGRDLVQSVSAAIGIEASPETIAEISEQLGALATLDSTPHDGDSALVECLQCYDGLVLHQPISSIRWPPSLFMTFDPEPVALQGAVDLTGAARYIVYGPYLHAPPGRWTVRAEFEVRENYSGNKLKMDAHAGGSAEPVLQEVVWTLPAKGRYAAAFQIDITSTHDHLEIRFFQMEGAIEGSFELLDVTLERIAP